MVFHDVDPIKTVTIFDVQWSNTPEEVVDAVRDYWRAAELGNDFYYVHFDVDDFDDTEYETIIANYLRGRGVNKCLLHFWW